MQAGPMRLLFLTALVVLLVPATASADPLEGAPERQLASRSFVASPRATFSLEIPEDAAVGFSVSIRNGLFEGLELFGPNGCIAQDPIDQAGTVHVSCGWVEAGTYRVVVEVDGTAYGSLHAQGGYFMPAATNQP